MTNNEYIQEVGVPPGNHGCQPKRPCNRAQGSADAFGFGPYNDAGTTASSQEDHVTGHRDPPMRFASGHTVMREPRPPAENTMYYRN